MSIIASHWLKCYPQLVLRIGPGLINAWMNNSCPIVGDLGGGKGETETSVADVSANPARRMKGGNPKKINIGPFSPRTMGIGHEILFGEMTCSKKIWKTNNEEWHMLVGPSHTP